MKDTYALLPQKIVKSEWLKQMLAQDGFPTHKIPLGMDLGIFYPRERQTNRPLTVLAMTIRASMKPALAPRARLAGPTSCGRRENG